MNPVANFDPRQLTDNELLANPLEEFQRWFTFAQVAGVRQPEAMALATSTPDGIPSVRYVLFKGILREAFAFYTHFPSRKGRELEANPRAAVAFHWPEFELQIRIEGRVDKATSEESESYFHSRPRDSQLGAHASDQGRPLSSPELFHERFDAVKKRFEGQPVPLPHHWGGFRLVPDNIEFWIGRPFRLHDRFLYLKAAQSNSWERLRLYP
jgi:pyridoxamine 5'-phosphate oxidase